MSLITDVMVSIRFARPTKSRRIASLRTLLRIGRDYRADASGGCKAWTHTHHS
jgi:hypothetical protein